MAAASAKFNPDALLEGFAACNAHVGDIPMEPFMQGVEELKRIVCALTRTCSPAAVLTPRRASRKCSTVLVMLPAPYCALRL
jgi:hypothetical protein